MNFDPREAAPGFRVSLMLTVKAAIKSYTLKHLSTTKKKNNECDGKKSFTNPVIYYIISQIGYTYLDQGFRASIGTPAARELHHSGSYQL